LHHTPFVLPETQLERLLSNKNTDMSPESKFATLLMQNYNATIYKLSEASTLREKKNLTKSLEIQRTALSQFQVSVKEKIKELINLNAAREIRNPEKFIEQLYFLAKALPKDDSHRGLILNFALLELNKLLSDDDSKIQPDFGLLRATQELLTEDLKSEFEKIKTPAETMSEIEFLHLLFKTLSTVNPKISNLTQEHVKAKLPESLKAEEVKTKLEPIFPKQIRTTSPVISTTSIRLKELSEQMEL